MLYPFDVVVLSSLYSIVSFDSFRLFSLLTSELVVVLLLLFDNYPLCNCILAQHRPLPGGLEAILTELKN